jgi:putative oxidoreductase
MKFLIALQPLGLLVLRFCLAIIFMYNGYPKLVHANEALRDFFIARGLPGYFVGVAGTLECFGAILLVTGLFTRPVALLLTIEMCVAIWKVHSGHGLMAVKEYEFPLTVASACFALATAGAGLISLDHLIFGEAGKKRRTAKRGKD